MQSLRHWATKEVPILVFLIENEYLHGVSSLVSLPRDLPCHPVVMNLWDPHQADVKRREVEGLEVHRMS